MTNFEQVLRLSLEAAQERKPLFEAGFMSNGGFARVDILNPVGQDGWDIVEVKSSTEVKDVNLLDLAFQSFVYNGAGLNIRRCWTRSFPVSKQPKTIGKHLRKQRFNLGIRQSQAAQRLGVSELTMSLLERNKVYPTWAYQPRLIEYLGYDPSTDPAPTFPLDWCAPCIPISGCLKTD